MPSTRAFEAALGTPPARDDTLALDLLLRVSEKAFELGTLSGNRLDPVPGDDVAALSAKQRSRPARHLLV